MFNIIDEIFSLKEESTEISVVVLNQTDYLYFSDC